MEKTNDIFLIQKNARCPICAGTIKIREHSGDIIIKCINCGSVLKVIDFGQTEGEFIAKIVGE